MEVLLSLTTSQSVILATSKAAMRGATILKSNDVKTRTLNPHTLLAFSGEAGDTIQFAEFIQANVALYSMRNGYDLSVGKIASFTRNELARSLRSRSPYTVNLLLAGVDVLEDGSTSTTEEKQEGEEKGKEVEKSKKVIPRLFWLDYLASSSGPVPYAAHGYAMYYCLSILDKHHNPNISTERGLEITRMCCEELRRRLPIDFKGLDVWVIDQEGIKSVELGDDPLVKSA